MNKSLINSCRVMLLLICGIFFSNIANAEIEIEWTENDRLYGSTNLIKWSEISDATHYQVRIGSTAGSSDIALRTVSAPALTVAVRGLPTDGQLLHITLRTRIADRWHTSFITSISAALSPVLEQSDLDLMSLSHRFVWRPLGEYTRRFQLIAHDEATLATSNIYGTRTITDDGDLTSWNAPNHGTVSGLPIDGSDVWVTLKWQAFGRWWTETPIRYVAADGSMITSPVDGSTLGGASTVFNWFGSVPQADRFRLQVGSDVYFANPGYNMHSLTAVGMPLNGSNVLVDLKYHDADDDRWYAAATGSYTAATPTAGIWGDCSAATMGLRALVFPAYAPIDIWGFIDPRGMVELDNAKAVAVLRDGCASDNNYVSPDLMEIYVKSDEKGIYLWLAAESGAAQVEIVGQEYWYSLPMFKVIAFHDDAAVANPIFIRTPEAGEYYRITIEPVDPTKPVRLSELRFARANDDVSALRKLRFRDPVGHGYFVATSSDPRGRVTAEIDRDFGPYYIGNEGRGPRPTSCGYYSWVDGTWIGNQGITLVGHTVWINWNLVSNAEVSAMLEQSVQAGIENGHWIYTCTPASAEWINQDWLLKAQQALNGSYTGPTLME